MKIHLNPNLRVAACLYSGVALTLVAFIAGCGGGSGSGATVLAPSPNAGEIVFTSTREVPGVENVGTGRKLFRVNLDGSNLTHIPTAHLASVTAPVWLPGRQGILYTGHTSLGGNSNSTSFVRSVNRDGTNDRIIGLPQSGHASASPDGRRIAYEVTDFTDPGRDGIYIANVDGTNPVRLTGGSSPSWSPDGQRIAYTFEANTNNGRVNSSIFVINVDGTNRRQLTTSAFSDTAFSDATFGHADYVPEFSPDGGRIAYTSIVSYTRFSSDYEVFVMNADGSSPTRLTNRDGDDLHPKWTPDGRRIAFISRRTTPEISGIYITNLDGSNQVPLLDTPGLTSEFSFDVR